jgi:hypothetical protein
MRKTHSGMLGFTSDEGFVVFDTENFGRRGLEGALTEVIFDVDYDEEGNLVANSAPIKITCIPPLRCSSHSSPQQCLHADNDNKVRQQDTNVNAKGVTPVPAMDAARAALRKAESTIKAQKMKNFFKQKQGAHVHCRCNCKVD